MEMKKKINHWNMYTLTSSKASLRSLFDTKIACSLFDLNINARFLNVPFV